MALYHKDIGKHIVTQGNLGMAEGGQPLYTMAGPRRDRRKAYNVVPGQLVAYTKQVGAVPTIVDQSTLSLSNSKRIFLGVGVDNEGKGYTTAIRHIGIEHVSSCALTEVQASSPKCGSPAVQDMYLKINKPGTYAVLLRVEDQKTRDYAPMFKGYEEFQAVTSVTEDEFEDPAFDPDIVVCKLIDQLNNKLDLKIKDKDYPDWKGKGLKRPFHATRLHDNSITYCFSPTEIEDCETCTHIDAVISATVGGQTVTFTGNVDPADNTKTLRAQLDHIANQINEAFEDDEGEYAQTGSAYVTGSYSDCCPIELHVNTCDATFALQTTGAAAITPKTSVNPFTEYGTFTNVKECIDCGDSETSTSYTTGFRVISEQVSTKCGAYINQPMTTYFRKVEITPIADFFDGDWQTVDIQKPENPGQFGSQIQWYEYQQDVGGEGRNHKRSNYLRGWIPVPDDLSRANSLLAKCDLDYCSYYTQFEMDRKGAIDAQAARPLQIDGYIHVPAKDVTTKAVVEQFLTELATFSPKCEVTASVICDTSQVADSLELV